MGLKIAEQFFRFKGRVESIRKHKTVMFINAFDPFKKETVQLKASPDTYTEIGGRGSTFDAEIDVHDENMIKKVYWCNRAANKIFNELHVTPTSEVHKIQSIIEGKDLGMHKKKSAVFQTIRNYLGNSGLVEIICPIITANNCEGGAEAFKIGSSGYVFKSPAYLTVSAQLHLELACTNNAGVFSIGPIFRAERHETRRHLAEFWMVEVEIPYITSLENIMNHCEMLFEHLLHEYPSLVSLTKKAKVVTYTDAVGAINKANGTTHWGMPLTCAHEIFLTKYFGECPIFIVDYPMEIKPFYMKQEILGQKKIAKCFDLIVPGMGEIAGGSLREDNFQLLAEKMKANSIDASRLDWYMHMRQTGHPPTAGYGIGIERLFCYLNNIQNVRESVMFPRSRGELHF